MAKNTDGHFSCRTSCRFHGRDVLIFIRYSKKYNPFSVKQQGIVREYQSEISYSYIITTYNNENKNNRMIKTMLLYTANKKTLLSQCNICVHDRQFEKSVSVACHAGID